MTTKFGNQWFTLHDDYWQNMLQVQCYMAYSHGHGSFFFLQISPFSYPTGFSPVRSHPPPQMKIEEPDKDIMAEETKATPLHQTPSDQTPHRKKDGDGSVKCTNCRPHPRDKITVVPLDNNGHARHSLPSPNVILKSIISSITKKSPRPGSDRTTNSSRDIEDQPWKVALTELSHKLIHATRRRDEAVLEASRLKHSVAELEQKLNKLEIYCQNLHSGLQECTSAATSSTSSLRPAKAVTFPKEHDIDRFLVSVSNARSAVRVLSRSLTAQLHHIGPKVVFDKLSQLLQPHDIKISATHRTLVIYLEAILNRAFYEDFECARFEKNRAPLLLNPNDRCEANLASFDSLCGLSWDDVLSKGTKHFSADFSRFCDRKMSEIVGMLGWAKAWPEPLLQAFFGASKAVWLVHLLANSVHPGIPIMRIDSGSRFDPGYMEDIGADRTRKLIQGTVGIMATPGFYVYGGVVKTKVVCRYYSSDSKSLFNEKGQKMRSP